jgi:hypothetical protein
MVSVPPAVTDCWTETAPEAFSRPDGGSGSARLEPDDPEYTPGICAQAMLDASKNSSTFRRITFMNLA